MRTPVLLLAWRRPAQLRAVIDALRPVAPSSVFVACDGPNLNLTAEVQAVSEVRELIEREINWPCEIHRLYAESNQGCRLGVSRAITWFFYHVEEGIILEDDCIPDPVFFDFCELMLSRYRHDSRVWCVSGSNFQRGQRRGDGSYYFSRYAHCWGWASWRRCWQHYDADLSLLAPLLAHKLDQALFADRVERDYWIRLWLKLLLEGKPDSWAYRWFFTCIVNGGLTVVPNGNLVVNIGFGAEATHTCRRGSDSIQETFTPPQKLDLAPTFVVRDAAADRFVFDHIFGGVHLRFPRNILTVLRKLIKQLLLLLPSRARRAG